MTTHFYANYTGRFVLLFHLYLLFKEINKNKQKKRKWKSCWCRPCLAWTGIWWSHNSKPDNWLFYTSIYIYSNQHKKQRRFLFVFFFPFFRVFIKFYRCWLMTSRHVQLGSTARSREKSSTQKNDKDLLLLLIPRNAFVYLVFAYSEYSIREYKSVYHIVYLFTTGNKQQMTWWLGNRF